MIVIPSPPKLKTERLEIRLPEFSEAPLIAEFFIENEQHLAPWGPTLPEGITTEPYWLYRIGQERDAAMAGTKYRFFLFLAGAVVGYANLNEIVRGGTQSCTMSYCVAAKHEGKGLMSEALRELIRFAFQDINLHRIEACYQPKNVRSGRVLERLGFCVEATLRKLILIDGIWADHVLASLINDKWKPDQG